MRRSHTEESNSSAEVNLTPLIDMVFILLIFFIVTSSFVKESGIEVNRPSAQTAERQERGNIIIAANDKGEVWIDKRKVDVHTVRTHVERLRAENPEGSVVILADEKSQTGLMVQIMDQVRLAGVANVSIAATSTSGPE
jgi:biopolymer transport protein ExbD